MAKKITNISGSNTALEKQFDAIMLNLNKQLNRVKNKTNKGLIISAIEVRRDMEKTPPLIPVDYGNLRASWFILTGATADIGVKSYEVKGGNFRTAENVNILSKLKEVHQETVAEMKTEVGKYPIGVAMGFSAYYAAAVHEMVASPKGKQINWSRPGSGAKFFQAALYRNIKKIISIVKMYAKIP